MEMRGDRKEKRMVRWGYREESRIGKAFFATLLVIYTGIMLYLFVMQCYEVPDFVSDMPAYVDKVAGIQGKYEFPYPVLFATAKLFAFFCGAPMAMAIASALYNSLGICVAKHYMSREVRNVTGYEELGEKKKVAVDIGVSAAVFVLFLISNLYSPKNTAFFGFDYAYRCMGIYTPNPIWNATYMATRPFAVMCFFETADVLRFYREGKVGESFPWKRCIPFAVSLLLTTMTKPSYTMVVVPLIALILLGHLIQSRGKSLRNAFCLGITMLPTAAALLYQYAGVFTGVNAEGEETGIGFAIGLVWRIYSKNILLSIVMGMALPLGVLVLNYKDIWKMHLYRFAWLNYLMATGMFLTLYEKGFRMDHANFSWGYMHGMFVVFMLTLVLVIRNTIQWRKSWKILFVIAEWVVLSVHLICGVNFLAYALQGKELAGF